MMIEKILFLLTKDLESKLIRVSGSNIFEVEGLINKIKEFYNNEILISCEFDYQRITESKPVTIHNFSEIFNDNN